MTQVTGLLVGDRLADADADLIAGAEPAAARACGRSRSRPGGRRAGLLSFQTHGKLDLGGAPEPAEEDVLERLALAGGRRDRRGRGRSPRESPARRRRSAGRARRAAPQRSSSTRHGPRRSATTAPRGRRRRSSARPGDRRSAGRDRSPRSCRPRDSCPRPARASRWSVLRRWTSRTHRSAVARRVVGARAVRRLEARPVAPACGSGRRERCRSRPASAPRCRRRPAAGRPCR